MKTTERFDNAVTKLYNAFHNGTLNAMDCTMCAVGNICNNSSDWYKYDIGYSKTEIQNIEQIFMFGCFIESGMYWDPIHVNKKNKKLLFKALCAVVEYLCELDNIPNVMDYTKLFETENDKPKYQLS